MVNIKIDYKKDIWLYALIAVILLIISIFTPWGSLEIDLGGGITVTAYTWTGGIGVTYYGAPSDSWVGSGLHLWTLGITMLCLGLLLFYAIHSWRGMEFKWDWLMYLIIGVLLILFPILALTVETTTGGVIGFAPIGIIIAGAVCIVAFVMEKFIAGRGAA